MSRNGSRYEPVLKRPKTLIVDVDGVIFRQIGRWPNIDRIDPKKDLLPGVREKFLEWEMKGYRLILVTGRSDNYRKLTEKQLEKAGIPYHDLIMAGGMGQRILVNNFKERESKTPTAVAINLKTDRGMKGREFDRI